MTGSPETPRGLAQRLRSLVFANRNDGPPDLDELWRDFNRKLSGLFGGKGGGPRRNGPGEPGGTGPNFQPDMRRCQHERRVRPRKSRSFAQFT